MKKLYYFEWLGGGYNSVHATDKRQAVKLANEMGKATEYAPGKMTVGLKPNPKSFTTNEKKQKELDRKWWTD
jgi:hypothetical protein